jgi:tetratricopeptide (TPR) repeat protein
VFHSLVRHIPVCLLLAAALSSGGCSTATLSLSSSPSEAEVYVRPVGGGEAKLVGKTPLAMKAAQLQDAAGGAGPLFLELRKEGHAPLQTLVTDLSAADLSLTLELKPSPSPGEAEKYNTSIDQLFESQRLARAGRYPDALARLKEVQKVFPELAASYEIEGGIYFLMKQFKSALDAYRQALRFNSANPDALRMRNLLEARLRPTEGRAPADAAAAGTAPTGGTP